MDFDRWEENGHTTWSFNKGVPCALENVADVVRSCYNHLVWSLLAEKLNASKAWYDNEIYTCCCKVLAVLDGQEFILPRFTDISYDQIISSFENIFTHERMTCGLYHALESLLVCTDVIWRLRSTNQLEAITKTTALEKCLVTAPLSCVTKDGRKCKGVARYPLLWLNSPPAGLESSSDQDLSVISQCMTYSAAFLQYQDKNFRGCLDVLHSFLQMIESNHNYIVQQNLSAVFNLVGCCCASLGLIQTAIVYFRKALLCEENNFASILNNTAAIYIRLGKFDAASQVMDILSTSFRAEKVSKEKQPILVFHGKYGLRQSCSSAISHWGWPATALDSSRAHYLAGNVALRAGKFETCAHYFQQVLSKQSHVLTLGTTEACFSLPSKEQILSEKQLALSECCQSLNAHDARLEFIELRNRLTLLSNKLGQILHEPRQGPDSNSLDDFIVCGRKLYHCMCNALCLTKRILRSGEDWFAHAYEALESWEPKFYSLSEQNWPGVPEELVDHLNSIQGKFLLNKAIWKMYVDRKSEVLKVLPSILKFAPKNLEIRWRVTLLLLKIGLKSSACETWLRTRGIDYRISGDEIRDLVRQKLAAAVPGHVKTLYERDIAILKEVYDSRQLTSLT